MAIEIASRSSLAMTEREDFFLKEERLALWNYSQWPVGDGFFLIEERLALWVYLQRLHI